MSCGAGMIAPPKCRPRAPSRSTVSAVPMKLDASNHIQIPVKLDGQDLTAMLDTGAIHTVLNLELAQSNFATAVRGYG